MESPKTACNHWPIPVRGMRVGCWSWNHWFYHTQPFQKQQAPHGTRSTWTQLKGQHLLERMEYHLLECMSPVTLGTCLGANEWKRQWPCSPSLPKRHCGTLSFPSLQFWAMKHRRSWCQRGQLLPGDTARSHGTTNYGWCQGTLDSLCPGTSWHEKDSPSPPGVGATFTQWGQGGAHVEPRWPVECLLVAPYPLWPCAHMRQAEKIPLCYSPRCFLSHSFLPLTNVRLES